MQKQFGEALRRQGCQMAYFKTKNPNSGKFWRVSQWKILVHFLAIWYILWPFCIFYAYLVYFMLIWYILCLFGIFFPVLVRCTKKNLATFSGAKGRKISSALH
jgi:hypothetical protein